MITFKQFLAEKLDDVIDHNGVFIDVFVNPTDADLSRLRGRNTNHIQLGIWFAPRSMKKVYVWNRELLDHKNVKRELGNRLGSDLFPAYGEYYPSEKKMVFRPALWSLGYMPDEEEIYRRVKAVPSFKGMKIYYAD